MENILQIADLTKRYPDFYLDHLTLNVPSGSIVGLIGENGAGKTTTMNLILNAVTKDSGDILVFGQDNLSHEKEVKQRIGVVQDECNLPFMFSPADIETIMRQIYAQWDTDRYWELLNRFDLPVKQEIGSFSKGMKVKMNFAIALAHHAELLLLDEATSGLDPVMRDDMLDLLLDFVQSEERGVFFSTHIMSDLSKIADYIAFLHEGSCLLCQLTILIDLLDVLIDCPNIHIIESRHHLLGQPDILILIAHFHALCTVTGSGHKGQVFRCAGSDRLFLFIVPHCNAFFLLYQFHIGPAVSELRLLPPV